MDEEEDKKSPAYLSFDRDRFLSKRIPIFLLRNSNALMEIPTASVNNNEKVSTALWAMVGMIL